MVKKVNQIVEMKVCFIFSSHQREDIFQAVEQQLHHFYHRHPSFILSQTFLFFSILFMIFFIVFNIFG